jgi:hypothetical protein
VRVPVAFGALAYLGEQMIFLEPFLAHKKSFISNKKAKRKLGFFVVTGRLRRGSF